jgi:hypothetical protein
MKHPAFTITFTPVAISIFCSFMLVLNEFVPVLPAWVLWQVLMSSTIIALFIIALLFVVWAAQRISQQITNPTA